MPEWLNEPGEWAALVTIFTAVMSGLLWIIRNEVRTTRKQLQPNGGKSMADKVDLLVARQSDLVTDIRELRAALADHNTAASQAHARLHARIDDHITDHPHGRK